MQQAWYSYSTCWEKNARGLAEKKTGLMITRQLILWVLAPLPPACLYPWARLCFVDLSASGTCRFVFLFLFCLFVCFCFCFVFLDFNLDLWPRPAGLWSRTSWCGPGRNNNVGKYSKSKCSGSIIWMHTAPGAYFLHAPGAVRISNMFAEHIWLTDY